MEGVDEFNDEEEEEEEEACSNVSLERTEILSMASSRFNNRRSGRESNKDK